LQGRPVTFEKLVYYLAWDTSAVLGTPMRIVTTIVIAFLLFGQVLFKSGGSAFFTDIAMVLMGRYRGGPAKISVFASALFGSISGSVVSNVVTTGVITIPLMRNGGYRAHLAGAIEAVASTGGQLMPPIMGAAAFLMAEFLQITYAEVVIAAIIPAVLYYVALFVQADLEAARSGITAIEKDRIPAAAPVLKAGWFFPLPFVVLIAALFWLNYLPETSALLAAAVIVVSAMALGYRGRRLGVLDLIDALRATGIGVLDIVMIGAAAGMVIGCISISGLGFALTQALVLIAGGNLILLLVMAAVVCIILGMGMPTVGVYVLLAALVAPALVEVGILPIAAHMFILYFGMMSMITPPVAIGAYAAATLTGADPLRTGFAAMRFGWLAFVIPFLFVASPTLLMEGSAFAVSV
ncbi:MAG: TRAP transporter permease, partial [Alphaproteobacteria bacterium]